MRLAYVIPRVIRHFMPEWLVRFMLLRSMIIKPGLETANPEDAVRQYEEILRAEPVSLSGGRVLVFGYGGRFDIGVGLLEAGASYVALLEMFASPDDRHNAALLRRFPEYIHRVSGAPRPSPRYMELIDGDIRTLPPRELDLRFDLVVSNSVYEHVDDAAGVTKALAAWTKPGALHIHFVDLRDHYFKYPFEMLTFSERTWRAFLNPSSNLNRLRLGDYRRVFGANFEQLEITILARDESALARVWSRLRPEFVSGNAAEDPATLIRITARRPLD